MEEKIEHMQRKRGEEVSSGLVVRSDFEGPFEDRFDQLEETIVGIAAIHRDVLY